MRMSTLPAASPLDDVGLLGRRAEAAEHLDLDGVVGHPLAERAVVLGGQHGRRHQHRHLPARLSRLERRPHGQLGLAVANVAAQQAVHRAGGGHVRVDLPRSADLVLGLDVDELLGKLSLPVGVSAG